MLQTHGWNQPSPNEKDRHNIALISPEAINKLQQIKDNIEGMAEHKQMEREAGFGYWQVLGELIYAYIVCRIDIGYAVVFLSWFSTAPAKEHYLAFEGVCKYLQCSKAWGLIYWRLSPVTSLPIIPLEQLPLDPEFPKIPSSELVGFIKCSTCHRCQKTTIHHRLGILLCRHSYCIQVQVANCDCYKLNRGRICCHNSCSEDSKVPVIHLESPWLCTGIAYYSLWDNKAAITMINQCKPTTCFCHIDVQFFAIQDWREQGDILMKHIPGILNMADDSTKALGVDSAS